MTDQDYELVKDLLRPLERSVSALEREIRELKNDVRDVERKVK